MNTSKRPIPELPTREAAEQILGHGSDDEICGVLLAISHRSPDWRWAEARALACTRHPSAPVRKAATNALVEVARIHGKLDVDVVIARLEEMKSDPEPETAKWAGYAITNIYRYVEMV